MTLLVSLASYMYVLASLHTHTSFTIATVHFLTLPSRLGVQGTVYHLFHCALLHSAEDKWTIFDSQITDLGVFGVGQYCFFNHAALYRKNFTSMQCTLHALFHLVQQICESALGAL